MLLLNFIHASGNVIADLFIFISFQLYSFSFALTFSVQIKEHEDIKPLMYCCVATQIHTKQKVHVSN